MHLRSIPILLTAANAILLFGAGHASGEGTSTGTTRPSPASAEVRPIRIRTSETYITPEQLPPTTMPAFDKTIELGSVGMSIPAIAAILNEQIPDPSDEHRGVAELIEKAKKELALKEKGGKAYDEALARLPEKERIEKQNLLQNVGYYEALFNLIVSIERPEKRPISLQEAVGRMLMHNYQIRTQGYGPAIDAARLVEAEAAFDAAYFLTLSNDKKDQPSPSQLSATQRRDFALSSGIRKLLPTGMQVETSLTWTRTYTNLVYQTLNPAHYDQFVVQFRQPLLRNFGIDYNRSQIRIAQNDRQISLQTFRREVRDRLADVEQAYEQLFQARRQVTIVARLLASFQQIYDFYVRRQRYDAYPVQIALTRSRLETLRATFIQARNRVRDTEDALKALMNDPDINLSTTFELIPTGSLIKDAVVLDPLGEVQTALENRSELKEARLRVDSARIVRGAAKNQLLPRCDLIFRYAVDGLGGSADAAFDEVTKNDFTEYLVSIEFEYPIGNRAAEAAYRRARLQESQAIAGLKATIEQIILDVNVRLRQVLTAYDVIEPSVEAAVAAEEDVKARVARQERKDPITLELELNARQDLSSRRNELLQALVNYSDATMNLEKSKGTLLQYNNVVLEEEP